MEDAQLRYQRPQARLMQPESVMVRRTRKMKKPAPTVTLMRCD
jgi:hypothetical protein